MESLSVRLRVRELMIQKGMKPTVAKLMSFDIGKSTAKQLLHDNPKSVKWADLLNLCINLNCTPRDLMEIHIPEDRLHHQHPLRPWLQSTIKMPLSDIYRMDQQQIDDLADWIEERKIQDWGSNWRESWKPQK